MRSADTLSLTVQYGSGNRVGRSKGGGGGGGETAVSKKMRETNHCTK